MSDERGVMSAEGTEVRSQKAKAKSQNGETGTGKWWERAADFLERKEAERHPQITQITQIGGRG